VNTGTNFARKAEYNIDLVDAPEKAAYDVVLLAVAHDEFREMGEEAIKAFGKPECVYFDIKYMLPAGSADGRL